MQLLKCNRLLLFTDKSRFTLSTDVKGFGEAMENVLLAGASFSMSGLVVGQ